MADWAKLKVVDLKAELKLRDLPQHGLKAELVARLAESDAGTTPVRDVAPENEQDAESAPPTDEVAASQPQSPIAAEPAPETTAEASEPQQADASIETYGQVGDATTETGVESATKQTTPLAEAPSDESQKRKRKSATPSPSEEETAAKRARALPRHELQREDAVAAPANGEMPAPVEVEQTAPTANEEAPQALPSAPAAHPPSPPPAAQAPDFTAPATNSNDDGMDVDMDDGVAPALHPATAALYISNLMRPLRPTDIQAHVSELAAAPGQAADDGVIVQFHLDQIRTHAFVVLSSAQAASRVRSRLHDRIWPNESNRKALSVDFVPPEKVSDWISMEEGGHGGGGGGGGGRPGRSTARWEVIYTKGADGIVEARLQQAGPASRPGPPPPGPFNQASATDIVPPTGPRSDRERERDRGARRESPLPRGSRGGDDPRQQQHQRIPPPPSELDYELQRTRARPVVSFQLVSPALAQRRVDNMRSFYTQDKRRFLGREINRYSFEEGDGFVDRGKEVFEGIRPPHRERGGGRGGRGGGKFGGGGRGGDRGRGRRGGGGGGGGGGGRQQSDRYLPGGGGDGGRRWDDDRGGRDRDRDRDRDRRY